MKEKVRWAFILDKDEFLRLSLNKILKKYGFEVAEIRDISELEERKKDIKGGMILADLEMEGLERWIPLLKKWNERFILMSPQITDDLTQRLKQIGIRRILKKPVEPRLLRKVIREMSFPDEVKFSPSVKVRGGSPIQSERR
ncbi:MAG: response regulator [Deltaproteobacteria bacterium]|nr:response regulator [Deltaproteobacteria bacterium]MBM4323062.1 response regulator [Deltaproteobacteria bacterium]MBM4347972.1 response regulator [Deltaproteobacteria bacterium]